MIRRPPRSTPLYSSAASDVYKRQLLLRASFSAPKVMHLLRCSPSVSHPDLQKFDGLLRTAIEQLTNSSLTDTQWLQASLPIKDVGPSVRRVSSLAIPAFISSAASSLYLQDVVLADCPVAECHYLQEYSSLWSSSFGQLPDPLPLKQSFWDRPGVCLLYTSPSPRDGLLSRMPSSA